MMRNLVVLLVVLLFLGWLLLMLSNNKPLVEVEEFNRRSVDLLGQPTIFPNKKSNIYAFFIRGRESTDFDRKRVKAYLKRYPDDAVLISHTGAGEEVILIFTN